LLCIFSTLQIGFMKPPIYPLVIKTRIGKIFASCTTDIHTGVEMSSMLANLHTLCTTQRYELPPASVIMGPLQLNSKASHFFLFNFYRVNSTPDVLENLRCVERRLGGSISYHISIANISAQSEYRHSKSFTRGIIV
jgi:hypothetical protein